MSKLFALSRVLEWFVWLERSITSMRLNLQRSRLREKQTQTHNINKVGDIYNIQYIARESGKTWGRKDRVSPG